MEAIDHLFASWKLLSCSHTRQNRRKTTIPTPTLAAQQRSDEFSETRGGDARDLGLWIRSMVREIGIDGKHL